MTFYRQQIPPKKQRSASRLWAALLPAFLLAVVVMAKEHDWEMEARDALDRWHDYYHSELHKTDTNNPAIGMYLSDGMEMGANTRKMQLRYFDRKVCRLFGTMTNLDNASNFVWQTDQWITKPLPTHPD